MGEGFSYQTCVYLVIWELFCDSRQVAVQTKKKSRKAETSAMKVGK